MIKVFIGENTQQAKKDLNKAIEDLSRDQNVTITRFSDVNFDKGQAIEAVYTQNLFGGGNIVVFEDILSNPDGGEFYDKEMKNAPNHLFIREVSPKKEQLATLRTLGEIKEFPVFTKAKRESNFAVAEAVAMRDKKRAWEEYVKASVRGSAPEEIHGMIFWAMKTVALCAKLDKAEALKAGVSAYTYPNYLTYSKKYLAAEIDDRLRDLKDMSHAAHRGEDDLSSLLEQYILRG